MCPAVRHDESEKDLRRYLKYVIEDPRVLHEVEKKLDRMMMDYADYLEWSRPDF
jgi:predicted oxidoreductase